VYVKDEVQPHIKQKKNLDGNGDNINCKTSIKTKRPAGKLPFLIDEVKGNI
jgi:hypothetical protein